MRHIIIQTCGKLIIVMGNFCHSKFNITVTRYNIITTEKKKHTHTNTSHRKTYYKMVKSLNIIKHDKTVSNYTHYIVGAVTQPLVLMILYVHNTYMIKYYYDNKYQMRI